MNQQERNQTIQLFGKLELTEVARTLLDALIQTWEESLGDDKGLQEELERLSGDKVFLNYVTRYRQRGYTPGVALVHTLQDLSLVTRLAQSYPLLAKIHLDRD